MRKRLFVPLNEEKTVSTGTETTTSTTIENKVNESSEELVTMEELKTGLNLLDLIRNGHSEYENYKAAMDITDNGKIRVQIWSDEEDAYSEIEINGRGVKDCEAALDMAIEEYIEYLYKTKGIELNESVKDAFLAGAIGLSLASGGVGGSLSDLKQSDAERYERIEQARNSIDRQAEDKLSREYDFYISKDWNLMDPKEEGYVYDKTEKGGYYILSVMVDEPRRGLERDDQYAQRHIYEFEVEKNIYDEYNVGDYINFEDIGIEVYSI